jgi:integrase/recombinase XerC
MSDLAEHVQEYLESLRRENASPHTVRNYGIDLDEFASYFAGGQSDPVSAQDIDLLSIREWLGHLYDRNLSPVTLRRKLASVRSLFKFLQRSGVVEKNVARLIRTPKAPQTVPRVMTAEHTNRLIDAVPAQAESADRPHPARDVAIFELLYGCGVRVSELVGLNVADVDLGQGWILVRGKGKKERQVPLAGKAAAALERYLEERSPKGSVRAVFLNHRGLRLTDRGVRNIVKFYSGLVLGDSSVHPHSFRHAYATHLLADGADLRSIQELLGHARLSTTQKYTQVALSDLMAVYDKTHPKA